MSLTLALDTSGRGGLLALARAGDLLAVARHDESQGHAESLSGLIDGLLEEAGHSMQQIEQLAVVRGPGSFTGLRIGIMTAKALAFARSLPIRSAATLPLLASAGDGEALMALFGAGGDHLYGALYAGERELSPPCRLSLASARELCERESIDRCLHAEDTRSSDLARRLGLSRLQSVALGAQLARQASLHAWPSEQADAVLLTPEYLGLSQAERTHGLDLSAQVHTPGPLEEWE